MLEKSKIWLEGVKESSYNLNFLMKNDRSVHQIP
jgi:hypothetical protein